MIQQIKRYLAIRSYMMRLSQDLVRRFDKRPFYSIEHVTKAVQRGSFPTAFIFYAHAAFCKQRDFDAHYQPLGAAGTYENLRRTIARRYLSGRTDFDAETIIYKYQRRDGSFYESGIGDPGGGDGHSH